jgi:hypothetical protein
MMLSRLATMANVPRLELVLVIDGGAVVVGIHSVF